MRKFLFLMIVMIHLSSSGFCQTDSLLQQLNAEIARKEQYEEEKKARLKKLHQRISLRMTDEKRFALLKDLSDEYETYIYDSAFSTIGKLQRTAYRLNDPTKIAYAKIRLAFILTSSGMFKETLDSLSHIDVHRLPDTLRSEYYFLMGRTYYDLSDFDKDGYYSPVYIKLGNLYIDSAKALSSPESYQHHYLTGLKNLKNENSKEALANLGQLLKNYKLSPRQLAVTASTLSYFYASRHQPEEAIALLTQATIADIRTATKETSALSTLAELLYQKGDIKNAYVYIQHAMDDAIFYGARQRKAQVGSILPIITSAKVNNVEEQRRLWLTYSAVITLLSMMVLFFLVTTLRQLKKRKLAERALQEANRIKEEYIGYYFNINSEYLGKIEAFKKSVEMKLMTKKLDDIKFIINNINLKREREALYRSFDKVFLKLFPDFVSVFNSYFREEDRIVLKEGQLLNTELRIFALIRLGIHDSEKIARILDYSINTIYNYKARVKGKSILPNEEFERKINEINTL
jgi:hypothetical protein